MIQYQSTPDYYRDYIEHGWLKDQAAKAHKYIDKYLGKNGKWIYKYARPAKNKIKDIYYREKSKAGVRDVKAVRKALKIKDPTIITDGAKRKRYPMFTKYSINKAYYGNSGKSDSRSSQRGSRVNEGIAAGRKRAKKAATIRKFNQRMIRKSFPTTNGGWYSKEYSQNFRTNNKDTKRLNPKLVAARQGASKITNKTKAQGYNSSVGSVTNNKATNNAARVMENKNRIKDQSVHTIDIFDVRTGKWTKGRETKKTRAKKNAEARRR